MVDSTQAPARGPGRPPLRSEDETRALIIAAAAKAFLETGYVRTGIDTIARDAGVSTRTLYRLFTAKEDLLKEAMDARIDAATDGLDAARLARLEPRASLEALLSSYADLALSDEAVRLTRLIAGERQEVPALAESYRQATARITGAFEAWVRDHQESGFLRTGDVETIAHLLRGTINEAQRQILLGLRGPFTGTERQNWVRASIDLFLDGFAA
ncbi:TetR/AcrR family transcriptional regulator [Pleomorphomonas sp. JP5]|uniref:TetR/AcrR family transcriptional regulator n=1 Tax=Pleomorphomonas sp. JP5 TaxID=2942998 RepID=UPI002043786F|nr:TetR/AcrR family transcriptional regulator [Pleomorphomonas sp. JP5]MCM5558793.1 TetR/AcrR family transcriptional regulator [Pleomorphomonas sp. JP5]